MNCKENVFDQSAEKEKPKKLLKQLGQSESKLKTNKF